MANVRWIGQAVAVAQVDKFTPANVEIGDIFTLTITGWTGLSHAVNYTAAAATVADVTAGLTTNWNNDTNALTTGITASDQTTYMDLTADTAGVAFSVASSAVNGGATGDQTLTRAAVTANAGPLDWSSGGNWDTGLAPGNAASQNVYIGDWVGDILYGLDQSGIANTLSSLNFDRSFTGKLGVEGATGYSGTYLEIKASKVDIGQHYGSGSPLGSARLMIDTGVVISTITVHHAATPLTYKPAVRLLAAAAPTVAHVRKGSVGFAFDPWETATIGTINETFVNQVNTDADVFIGSGVTLTTLTKKAGDCTIGCAATTVTNEAGDLIVRGAGAVTTMNIFGGNATCDSTGTISTLNIKGSGVADFTKSTAARTVTDVKLDPRGKIKYDPAIVTITNGVQTVSSSGDTSIAAA
jgi:hypothetical protein